MQNPTCNGYPLASNTPLMYNHQGQPHPQPIGSSFLEELNDLSSMTSPSVYSYTGGNQQQHPNNNSNNNNPRYHQINPPNIQRYNVPSLNLYPAMGTPYQDNTFYLNRMPPPAPNTMSNQYRTGSSHYKVEEGNRNSTYSPYYPHVSTHYMSQTSSSSNTMLSSNKIAQGGDSRGGESYINMLNSGPNVAGPTHVGGSMGQMIRCYPTAIGQDMLGGIARHNFAVPSPINPQSGSHYEAVPSNMQHYPDREPKYNPMHYPPPNNNSSKYGNQGYVSTQAQDPTKFYMAQPSPQNGSNMIGTNVPDQYQSCNSSNTTAKDPFDPYSKMGVGGSNRQQSQMSSHPNFAQGGGGAPYYPSYNSSLKPETPKQAYSPSVGVGGTDTYGAIESQRQTPNTPITSTFTVPDIHYPPIMRSYNEPQPPQPSYMGAVGAPPRSSIPGSASKYQTSAPSFQSMLLDQEYDYSSYPPKYPPEQAGSGKSLATHSLPQSEPKISNNANNSNPTIVSSQMTPVSYVPYTSGGVSSDTFPNANTLKRAENKAAPNNQYYDCPVPGAVLNYMTATSSEATPSPATPYADVAYKPTPNHLYNNYPHRPYITNPPANSLGGVGSGVEMGKDLGSNIYFYNQQPGPRHHVVQIQQQQQPSYLAPRPAHVLGATVPPSNTFNYGPSYANQPKLYAVKQPPHVYEMPPQQSAPFTHTGQEGVILGPKIPPPPSLSSSSLSAPPAQPPKKKRPPRQRKKPPPKIEGEETVAQKASLNDSGPNSGDKVNAVKKKKRAPIGDGKTTAIVSGTAADPNISNNSLDIHSASIDSNNDTSVINSIAMGNFSSHAPDSGLPSVPTFNAIETKDLSFTNDGASVSGDQSKNDNVDTSIIETVNLSAVATGAADSSVGTLGTAVSTPKKRPPRPRIMKLKTPIVVGSKRKKKRKRRGPGAGSSEDDDDKDVSVRAPRDYASRKPTINVPAGTAPISGGEEIPQPEELTTTDDPNKIVEATNNSECTPDAPLPQTTIENVEAIAAGNIKFPDIPIEKRRSGRQVKRKVYLDEEIDDEIFESEMFSSSSAAKNKDVTASLETCDKETGLATTTDNDVTSVNVPTVPGPKRGAPPGPRKPKKGKVGDVATADGTKSSVIFYDKDDTIFGDDHGLDDDVTDPFTILTRRHAAGFKAEMVSMSTESGREALHVSKVKGKGITLAVPFIFDLDYLLNFGYDQIVIEKILDVRTVRKAVLQEQILETNNDQPMKESVEIDKTEVVSIDQTSIDDVTKTEILDELSETKPEISDLVLNSDAVDQDVSEPCDAAPLKMGEKEINQEFVLNLKNETHVMDSSEKLQSEEMVEVEEFFVKFKNFSYMHCQWMDENMLTFLDKRVSHKIRRFKQRKEQMENGTSNFLEFNDDVFNPDYLEIERVLGEDIFDFSYFDLEYVDVVEEEENVKSETADDSAVATLDPEESIIVSENLTTQDLPLETEKEIESSDAPLDLVAPNEIVERSDEMITSAQPTVDSSGMPVVESSPEPEETKVEEQMNDSVAVVKCIARKKPQNKKVGSSLEGGEGKCKREGKIYLVKWRALPYEDISWERECFVDKEKIAAFRRHQKVPALSNKRTPRPEPTSWRPIPETVEYKNGNKLREYQLEGVNWLSFCWYNRQNCILADEMGLGKTVQSITFLMEMYTAGVRGPYLILAPLSTIGNWQREFELWSHLNVIVYHGSSTSRQIVQEFEMYFRDSKGYRLADVYKFNAIITTYEILMQDCEILKNIWWRACIIDEAHRLKNAKCKLMEGIKSLKMDHRVLLTGTPLQNNIEELWSLLNFLEPIKFESSQNFMSEYGTLDTEDQVKKLQDLLRPMMLRRLKEDVEKSLAPKEETIIEVELTNIQKKYYRAILEKNFEYLAKGTSSQSNVPNLMNVMMELRKCCIHPYLIKGAEEKILGEEGIVEKVENGENATNNSSFKLLINASGKLVLIDKLLPKLKSDGHKVLIFSQMVRCLDLLEDYLIHKRYPFERLDGRIRGDLRQAAIDRFSKPDSDRFVFLLCTRAGGLGINLTAADTCIIFDSDWNPQNDLQAQARCHRIGQSKRVQIYRLICRNTYEREMFDRAGKKLGLDKAVLQSMRTNDLSAGGGAGGKEAIFNNKGQLTKKEIEDLLKKGAYGGLMDDDNAGDKFCEEDIEQILSRRTQVVVLDDVANAQPNTDDPGSTNSNKAYSSTFAKASFTAAGNRSDIDIDDPNFWQKWAEKAEVDMDKLHSKKNKDLLLQSALSSRRVRRQTLRYGEQDDYSPPDYDDEGNSAQTSLDVLQVAMMHGKMSAAALLGSSRTSGGKRNKRLGPKTGSKHKSAASPHLKDDCDDLSEDYHFPSASGSSRGRAGGRAGKLSAGGWRGDEGAAEDSTSGGDDKKRWGRNECFRAEKALITYGWGRWADAMKEFEEPTQPALPDIKGSVVPDPSAPNLAVLLNKPPPSSEDSKNAAPPPITPDQLISLSRLLILHCLKYYHGDHNIKSFIWELIDPQREDYFAAGRDRHKFKNHTGLSAPVPRGRKGKRKLEDELDEFLSPDYNGSIADNAPPPPADANLGGDWGSSYDTEWLLGDPGYRRHLQRHANKVLLRVRMLYYLESEIIGDFKECILSGSKSVSELDILLPPFVDPEIPAVWWNEEADKSLLVGTFKHGYEKYEEMKTDPLLSFATLCAPQKCPTNPAKDCSSIKREGDLEGGEEENVLNHQVVEDPDAEDELEEGEIRKNRSAQGRKLKSITKLEALDENFEPYFGASYDFPSPSALSARFRRIITAYQRAHKKLLQKFEKNNEKREKLLKEQMAFKSATAKATTTTEGGQHPSNYSHKGGQRGATPTSQDYADTPTLTLDAPTTSATATSFNRVYSRACRSLTLYARAVNQLEALSAPSLPIGRSGGDTDGGNGGDRLITRLGADWSVRDHVELSTVLADVGVTCTSGVEEGSGDAEWSAGPNCADSVKRKRARRSVVQQQQQAQLGSKQYKPVFDWSTHRRFYTFPRKTDAHIEEYTLGLYAGALRTLRLPLYPEEERALRFVPEIGDRLTEEKAINLIDKIDLMNAIRLELLPHPDLESVLMLSTTAPDSNGPLPPWWISGLHDRELLIGVACHGLGNIESDVFLNSAFSFSTARKLFRGKAESLGQKWAQPAATGSDPISAIIDVMITTIERWEASSKDGLSSSTEGSISKIPALPTITLDDLKWPKPSLIFERLRDMCDRVLLRGRVKIVWRSRDDEGRYLPQLPPPPPQHAPPPAASGTGGSGKKGSSLSPGPGHSQKLSRRGESDFAPPEDSYLLSTLFKFPLNAPDASVKGGSKKESSSSQQQQQVINKRNECLAFLEDLQRVATGGSGENQSRHHHPLPPPLLASIFPTSQRQHGAGKGTGSSNSGGGGTEPSMGEAAEFWKILLANMNNEHHNHPFPPLLPNVARSPGRRKKDEQPITQRAAPSAGTGGRRGGRRKKGVSMLSAGGGSNNNLRLSPEHDEDVNNPGSKGGNKYQTGSGDLTCAGVSALESLNNSPVVAKILAMKRKLSSACTPANESLDLAVPISFPLNKLSKQGTVDGKERNELLDESVLDLSSPKIFNRLSEALAMSQDSKRSTPQQPWTKSSHFVDALINSPDSKKKISPAGAAGVAGRNSEMLEYQLDPDYKVGAPLAKTTPGGSGSRKVRVSANKNDNNKSSASSPCRSLKTNLPGKKVARKDEREEVNKEATTPPPLPRPDSSQHSPSNPQSSDDHNMMTHNTSSMYPSHHPLFPSPYLMPPHPPPGSMMSPFSFFANHQQRPTSRSKGATDMGGTSHDFFGTPPMSHFNPFAGLGPHPNHPSFYPSFNPSHPMAGLAGSGMPPPHLLATALEDYFSQAGGKKRNSSPAASKHRKAASSRGSSVDLAATTSSTALPTGGTSSPNTNTNNEQEMTDRNHPFHPHHPTPFGPLGMGGTMPFMPPFLPPNMSPDGEENGNPNSMAARQYHHFMMMMAMSSAAMQQQQQEQASGSGASSDGKKSSFAQHPGLPPHHPFAPPPPHYPFFPPSALMGSSSPLVGTGMSPFHHHPGRHHPFYPSHHPYSASSPPHNPFSEHSKQQQQQPNTPSGGGSKAKRGATRTSHKKSNERGEVRANKKQSVVEEHPASSEEAPTRPPSSVGGSASALGGKLLERIVNKIKKKGEEK